MTMDDTAPARTIPPRPRLLLGGLLFSAAVGVLLAVVLILALLPTGISFHVDRDFVSGAELLRRLGVHMAVLDVACLSVAYGLFRQRAWVRHAMVLWIVVFGAPQYLFPSWGWTPPGGPGPILLSLVPLAVAVWYLYLKGNVAEYFGAIRSASRGQ